MHVASTLFAFASALLLLPHVSAEARGNVGHTLHRHHRHHNAKALSTPINLAKLNKGVELTAGACATARPVVKTKAAKALKKPSATSLASKKAAAVKASVKALVKASKKKVSTAKKASTTKKVATSKTTKAAKSSTPKKAVVASASPAKLAVSFSRKKTSTARTSTAAAASTPAAASTASTAGGSVQAESLAVHNAFRAKHNAPPMRTNATLVTAAQAWADRCVFEHGGGATIGAGENLSAWTGNGDSAFGIQMWLDEESDYTPSAPTHSHYTQVVWKASTSLGCAFANCDRLAALDNSASKLMVCEYYPAGNVYPASNFLKNVE